MAESNCLNREGKERYISMLSHIWGFICTLGELPNTEGDNKGKKKKAIR